jgi:protein-disulfide isomerase
MMRTFLLSLSFLLAFTARAENFPQNDEEFFRQMRAKRDAEQLEEELKNPKKPEMPKDRAVRGNRSAPIVVVEYSDFQCPYCKKGFEIAEELKKKHGNKMVFMFKNFPLQFHPMAMPSAKRFEAIALQSPSKAYAFHDCVFKNQEKLAGGGEAFLDECTKTAKANVEKAKKDAESDTVKKHIDADMAEAQNYGISGTPGFVVMGVTLKGAYPIEMFEQIIDKRLAKK